MAGSVLNFRPGRHRRYPASFTVEASLVLGVVFLTMAAVIREAYVLHDTVTGGMILAETVETAVSSHDKEKDADYFISCGEERGNPRLWLGQYGIKLDIEEREIKGSAAAGEWMLEIDIKRFRPEVFLRRVEALRETENGQDDRSGGI